MQWWLLIALDVTVSNQEAAATQQQTHRSFAFTTHHTYTSPNNITNKPNISGGELFDRIVAKGHYTERDAASLIRTIVAVVAHCHQMNVIHRDLKPENFLLQDAAEEAPVKATDFGLSVFFKDGQEFSDIVGSAYYVAPEVLRRRYGKEADIWSCGVMLYILLCGMPPFYGDSEQQIFESVIKAPLDFTTDPWPKISEPAKVSE